MGILVSQKYRDLKTTLRKTTQFKNVKDLNTSSNKVAKKHIKDYQYHVTSKLGSETMRYYAIPITIAKIQRKDNTMLEK